MITLRVCHVIIKDGFIYLLARPVGGITRPPGGWDLSSNRFALSVINRAALARCPMLSLAADAALDTRRYTKQTRRWRIYQTHCGLNGDAVSALSSDRLISLWSTIARCGSDIERRLERQWHYSPAGCRRQWEYSLPRVRVSWCVFSLLELCGNECTS